VTRVDVAVDMPGYTADDLTIMNKRKHAHFADRGR